MFAFDGLFTMTPDDSAYLPDKVHLVSGGEAGDSILDVALVSNVNPYGINAIAIATAAARLMISTPSGVPMKMTPTKNSVLCHVARILDLSKPTA